MSAETIIYTPQTVELILRQLPYRQARQEPQGRQFDPDQGRGTRSRWAAFEDDDLASILSALDRLPQPTYRIVYLSYIGAQSIRQVAALVNVSRETVRRHRIDGICRMAWELGWRDAEAGYP